MRVSSRRNWNGNRNQTENPWPLGPVGTERYHSQKKEPKLYFVVKKNKAFVGKNTFAVTVSEHLTKLCRNLSSEEIQIEIFNICEMN